MNPQGGVDLAQNPKLALGAAAVAGGAGLGTLLSFIPAMLGIVVSTLSIIMLVVLIRMHLINSKKIVMEMKQLKDEAKCRQEAGLPCRRHGDSIEEE